MSIIYIAGLQRSGTTFLQSQLLQYNNVVALGEVNQTINAIRNIDNKTPKWKLRVNRRKENYWNPKTYPILLERIEKDEFWSSVKGDIVSAADLQSALKLVYIRANEKYPDHIFIDSSKSINSLKRVIEIEEFKNNIKVLFCIRDYRGWLYSTKKHRKRINIPQRSNIAEIYKWLFSNQKILNYLDKNSKHQYRIISYDKLVFTYEDVMKKISTFCNLQYIEGAESTQKFHEILGSQSLKKNAEPKNVRYDAEWFSYTGSCLEIPVQLFNKKIYIKYTV